MISSGSIAGETSANAANGLGVAGVGGKSCGTCFAWERIDRSWGLCVTDDTETRVDDACECYTPQEARHD